MSCITLKGQCDTVQGLVANGPRERGRAPHPWIRTEVREALHTAMGRHGHDDYTKVLVSTSRGWYDVCQMANPELGAGHVLE